VFLLLRESSSTSSLSDGSKYDGMWKANHRHGKGTLIMANGDRFVGTFKHGKVRRESGRETRKSQGKEVGKETSKRRIEEELEEEIGK
jgi:hypothetical protein